MVPHTALIAKFILITCRNDKNLAVFLSIEALLDINAIVYSSPNTFGRNT